MVNRLLRREERATSVILPDAPSHDWHDDTYYERLSQVDRGGLMWEWLRRDPEYRAWHLVASRATTGIAPDPAAWGLHFR